MKVLLLSLAIAASFYCCHGQDRGASGYDEVPAERPGRGYRPDPPKGDRGYRVPPKDGGYPPKVPVGYPPKVPVGYPPKVPVGYPPKVPVGYPPKPAGGYAPNNYPAPGGYGGDNYARPSYPSYRPGPTYEEEPLGIEDKLYERVNDVTRQLKFAGEALDAVDARMSLIKKFVDELTLVIFPAIERRNEEQNNQISKLQTHLDNLMDDLADLENAIDWLETQNTGNSDDIGSLENRYASAKRVDVDQDGSVANLHFAVKDFKAKLFLVLLNEFELFYDQVEVVAGKLDGTKRREKARMCETGSVTLKADDRKAEYVFQSDFDQVPGVIYSITGLEGNLDVIKDNRYDQRPSYGYAYDEPNAGGVLVLGYATKRSVTFEGYDLSFGDTAAFTVDVDFQVCTIGPGSEESDAHDIPQETTEAPGYE